MPKFNMYQSLHTTVIGPQGKPVEIQIRTHEMHRRAEYGVAAHWKYKSKQQTAAEKSATEMAWLRQVLDWQRETTDPSEFLDSLRFEIGSAEVYVFTPKGDVMALPAGSRSEEHTSELQSRGHLVCRLLLEKKKNREYSGTLSDERKLPATRT